jgi:hypothetical protein
LKVTVTVRVSLLVRPLIVQTFPLVESQPLQVAIVEGAIGVAVIVIGVLGGNRAAQVVEQESPVGMLFVKPVPPPNFTSTAGWVEPFPVKHTTVAVI